MLWKDIWGFDNKVDEIVEKEEHCTYNNWRERYNKYIASQEWKWKSFEFKIKNGYACSLCGSHDKLETHHRKYPFDFKDDVPDNWVVLCDFCHKKIHGIKSEQHIKNEMQR